MCGYGGVWKHEIEPSRDPHGTLGQSPCGKAMQMRSPFQGRGLNAFWPWALLVDFLFCFVLLFVFETRAWFAAQASLKSESLLLQPGVTDYSCVPPLLSWCPPPSPACSPLQHKKSRTHLWLDAPMNLLKLSRKVSWINGTGSTSDGWLLFHLSVLTGTGFRKEAVSLVYLTLKWLAKAQ